MTIRERELRERLGGHDDEDIYAALVESFEPVPGPTPFVSSWIPRMGLSFEADDALDGLASEGPPTARSALRDRLLGLANGAQRAWRLRRFARRRAESPHWPVVVCEGDSWVAHPLIDDITDHLLDDDDLPLHALGVGAASDLLAAMEAARDHEQAAEQHGASALLLSGGGNDLMLGFPRFLHPWRAGSDPQRLLTEAVDAHMLGLMKTLQRLLVRARKRLPNLPIVVHGYDYLHCNDYERGGSLGALFDRAGIRSSDERHAVLWAIVDRYNEHLQGVAACVRGVSYVDLRGLVPREQWADEIHPTASGFRRLAGRIARVLLERIANG